jgi:hypothetical protein
LIGSIIGYYHPRADLGKVADEKPGEIASGFATEPTEFIEKTTKKLCGFRVFRAEKIL